MRNLVLLTVFLLSIAGCTPAVTLKDINDNPDKYLGKEVVVHGTVSVPLNVAQMSGFNLKANGSSVMVYSERLPEAKSEVSVRGTYVKGFFTSPYIYATEVKAK
jgi:hypothetical protein